MASIKGSFDLQTVKAQTPSSCPQLRCCGKPVMLLVGEMGKGTSSGSRSLRMVPDNHGRNRNPFAFEISNHCSFLSTFPSTLSRAPMLSTVYWALPPDVTPTHLSCSLLWVVGDIVLLTLLGPSPLCRDATFQGMLPSAVQPQSEQGLSGRKGGFQLCQSALSVGTLHHPASPGGRQHKSLVPGSSLGDKCPP